MADSEAERESTPVRGKGADVWSRSPTHVVVWSVAGLSALVLRRLILASRAQYAVPGICHPQGPGQARGAVGRVSSPFDTHILSQGC
jgi:hypothetical protein